MCSLFGVGVLVYSIVVGVLVSCNGFMLSSVKSEFVLSDLLCRNLGMVNGCLGGGFARSHEKSLSPGVDTKSL